MVQLKCLRNIKSKGKNKSVLAPKLWLNLNNVGCRVLKNQGVKH